MYAPVRSFAIAVLVASAACGGASTRSRSRVDSSVLTGEQLEELHYQTVLEGVQALRANWLNQRGPDSFLAPSQIWVYLDNTRLGGVQTLGQISPRLVSTVRKLNGIDATARWGLGHSAGVIAVTTWPPQEDPRLLGPNAPPDTVALSDSAVTTAPDSSARRRP